MFKTFLCLRILLSLLKVTVTRIIATSTDYNIVVHTVLASSLSVAFKVVTGHLMSMINLFKYSMSQDLHNDSRFQINSLHS